jgi:hypothetical protein
MHFYGLKFLADTNIFLVLFSALPLEVSWLRHWLREHFISYVVTIFCIVPN